MASPAFDDQAFDTAAFDTDAFDMDAGTPGAPVDQDVRERRRRAVRFRTRRKGGG